MQSPVARPAGTFGKNMSSDGQVYLKIGEVARVVGISPSAIRAWEALGLTRPRRTRSQYRL
ncbi:MAG: MerR family transcriptional regulator, partial [Terriglobales bacterium]